MKLSLVIPAKDKNDQKLADLLCSIDAQDFPKDQMEVLVITEGTSESAKAIGIRQAKGEVIGILASDNVLTDERFLSLGYSTAMDWWTAQPARYAHRWSDDALTRYFALIGGNDPLAFYLGKNDKSPHYNAMVNIDMNNKTTGDNGYFARKVNLMSTNLGQYFHIDNSQETIAPTVFFSEIAHNTGGNIFKFFAKRYRYGLQHAFNPNRRWHLVEKTPRDIGRLLCFIFVTLTILQPLFLSIRGYLKIRDVAWFLHPFVCILTLFTYGLLILRLIVSRLFQSLFAPMAAQKA